MRPFGPQSRAQRSRKRVPRAPSAPAKLDDSIIHSGRGQSGAVRPSDYALPRSSIATSRANVVLAREA